MQSSDIRKKELYKTVLAVLICTVILLIAYILLFSLTTTTNDKGEKINRLFQHSAYDTYTIQAMHWREGKIKLDQDYPWLELAIYKGDYYVSFPPFPAVPMYLLSFIYGEMTPSNGVVMVYNILAFIFAFLCCRRMGATILISVFGACFTNIASACLFMSISGGVWFMAQLLAIMLTMAAFYLMLGENRAGWYMAMLLLALAVGCRPFQVVYFVFFIYLLIKKHHFKVLKTWTYFIAPGIIASIYMWYNYIRFGNVFEFGHNYLPEFTRDNVPKFSTTYIAGRFKDYFLTHPRLTENGLKYNGFGFTFYISNIIFVILFFSLMLYLYKQAKDKTVDNNAMEVFILSILVSIHVFLFLLHRTAGGWQFGARYMADAVPGALVCIMYCKNLLYKKAYVPVLVLLSFGIALNLFGTLKTVL